jgi:hypothetical protein
MGLTQSSPIEKTDGDNKDKTEIVVENAVDNVVDNAINNTVDNAINNTVDNAVNNTVDNTVDNAVNNTVDNAVNNVVDNAVNNVVDNVIDNDIVVLSTICEDKNKKIDYTLKESIDSFVAKIIKEAAIEASKKQSNINPKYREWLMYLRKWTVLDTKKNKDLILKTIDNDIENNITNNADTFGLIYNKYYNNYCSLGKVAFDITRTNFRINDSNIMINITKKL